MSVAEYQLKLPQSILTRESNSAVGKIWALAATQGDEINTTVEAMKDLEFIFGQTGVNLDQIGTLVLQTRAGTDDDEYRLLLAIAIAKKFSGGSLSEIIEIGRSLTALEGSSFRVIEGYENVQPTFLDGAGFLDGENPLSGSSYRDATVEIRSEGDVDLLTVPALVAAMLQQIRAAGITANTRAVLRSNTSDMQRYVDAPTGYLDGLGVLSGTHRMAGPKLGYYATDIAFGDGSTGPAEPGDTGLGNEIDRRSVSITRDLASGNWTFSVVYAESEIVGESINEFALYAGAQMVLKRTFSDKLKTSDLKFEFAIKEDLN